MRLTKYEITSIKKAFKETFVSGNIYLFGSRVDDSQKGGDIDLYITNHNIQNFLLKQKLYECDKHVEKLNDAKEYLLKDMPLTLEEYLKIDKIQSSFIDQLNFRFTKLQDTIGESILKGILIVSQEDVKKMTFLDILNRLEGLEIIDKNEWINLREVRNEIAHEYSFNQDEVVDSINLIYDKSDELIVVYKRLCQFIKSMDNE